MSNKYTPGEVTTVGELEVGDTVFLQARKAVGEPVPTHAATVVDLVPASTGHILVRVKSANAGASVAPRLLGQLPVTREFRRAVLAV